MTPKIPLEQALTTTETLLARYLEALTPNKTEPVTLNNPPQALPLLSDCARLLKAQVTKLSLLAINKPFTPSAISSVLTDTSTSCLPAMMSAIQICESQTSIFGKFFVDEARSRVRGVIHEMLGLVREVESIAEEAKSSASKRSDNGGRDSLSSTGIVWSGCDDIIALTVAGVADLAVKKAEAYRDMIKDAIEELQEWREGDDLENEGQDDHLLDSDDEGVDGDRDSLNGIFNAANSLPADRPELKALVEDAENKLKKIAILYTAVTKRRLKLFPAHPTSEEGDTMGRLAKTISILKELPDLVDSMTLKLYDLDEAASRSELDAILSRANEVATILQRNAKDEEDEFTVWLSRWKEAVNG